MLGVGRGTVPREVLHLNDKGVSIGSHDNPDQAAADVHNREVFEESMEIVRLALRERVVLVPGQALPDPDPRHPRPRLDGADRSPDPASAVPVRDLAGGHQSADARLRARGRSRRGVLEPAPLVHQAVLGHVRREATRRRTASTLAPHEKRMLVVAVRIEDTYEKAAMASARNGHDEFWKFLGPYGWSRGYMGEDGKPRQARADPDARRVDREQDDPASARPSRSPRRCSSTETCSASRT